MRKLTTEQFIGKAKQVHGDKYDYSKVEYKNCSTNVCIICKKHGEFWQRPDKHLIGRGCPKCGIESRSLIQRNSNEEFIEKAKQVHGNRYDYSKVECYGNKVKVCIICKKHGEFWQKPSNHLSGNGCPKCNSSHLEGEMRQFLETNNIEFDEQARFEWLGLQSLDFFLPTYNIAIECQGRQHFKPIDFSGNGEKWAVENFEKVCEFISKNKDVVKAVSVNFSVYQMVNPGIKDFVFSTIEKYGIKPENIIMEITESILIDDFELVRSRMEEFVKAGIIFYLDDFGTGFSNFANVIRLPFYTIKIDRSFVLMMERDEEMLKLVKNLISTFKDSNLKILVEGVETEAQDKLVKNAGVDYIQGFLYSKPLPMDTYIELLRKQMTEKKLD